VLRRVIASASLLMLGSASPLPAQPAAIPWKAIVLIRCGDWYGTAFHIGGGRYITADHVIEGAKTCLDTLSSLKVVGEDGAHDIAELSGPVISEKFEIDCAGYRSGREYLAVGYANGEYRTQFPLIYSEFGRDPESGNGMFIGADVIPGMSGGPMINGQFRVTGIVNQRWPSRSRALADTYLCGGKIA
jgi:S1-C subfamily serine protease